MTKEKLLTTFLLALFATSGPLAKYLSGSYHIDSSTIEFILTVGTMGTPLLAGGVYAFMSTVASSIARIQAMPRAQQTQVVSAIPIESRIAAASTLSTNDAIKVAAALPVEAKMADAANMNPIDAVKMAVALPNEANLAAVNAMPEVTKVVVKDNAANGVGAALRDSSLEKVVPRSQPEDGRT